MDKNRKTAIFIGVAAVVVLGLLYLFSQGEERYFWGETYNDDGVQPYDLSLFKNVLKQSSAEFEVLDGLFSDKTYLESSGNTMVYVAGYAWIDSTEAQLLKQFIEKGNNLLVSSKSAGKTMRSLIDCHAEADEAPSDKQESKSILVETESGSFELSFDTYNQPGLHSWVYFKDDLCTESKGFIELNGGRYPNLVEEQMGKGKLFLHSTPLVFTNYHFRNDSVFSYVNELLSNLGGETYYYLEPGISPSPSDGPPIGESPLKFILAHQSLKWAWYLTIILAFLYIINSMRRKQRAIPVVSLPENQTSAYLDMVYQLFRKEGSHRDIVQSQIKLLHSFLRNRYSLNAKKLNDDFFELASAKLKLDKNYIEQFFKQLERSRYNSTLNDSELLKIDREITEFYLRCP